MVVWRREAGVGYVATGEPLFGPIDAIISIVRLHTSRLLFHHHHHYHYATHLIILLGIASHLLALAPITRLQQHPV
ncbi:hypothetical protein C8F04DRAFT_1269205 [Mycena alexandri]|uniref:Uncharacterized protein n=1 Tax=Mycena alexandri TaxID=1745969 RepID=A0AAD6WUN3_9AGAR|nr:hypothetical protein C8F04DRAFT_1269205 [Mycena alexandri]